jgi:hypothetical protein
VKDTVQEFFLEKLYASYQDKHGPKAKQEALDAAIAALPEDNYILNGNTCVGAPPYISCNSVCNIFPQASTIDLRAYQHFLSSFSLLLLVFPMN